MQGLKFPCVWPSLHKRLGASILIGLVTACGGSGGNGPINPPKGISGLASYGAPIVEGTVSVIDVNGIVVRQFNTSKQGDWTFEITDDDKTAHPFPWVIKGEGVGVPTVWGIVFESDIGVKDQSVNVNPFTSATLALVGVNIGDGTLDPTDLSALKNQSPDTIRLAGSQLTSVIESALQKLPDPPPKGNIFEMLRTTPFWGTSTGLDAVLDNVPIRLSSDNKITLQVPALSVAVTIDPLSKAGVESQIASTSQTIGAAVTTSGNLLQTPPALLAFDVQSSWGSATDSWAGFTGAATLVATKDYGKSPVIKLTSKGFPAAGWWGASASYDATTGDITLTLPEYTNVVAGQTYSLGFNGTASKESFESAVKTASGCRINGDPCVITFGPAKSTDQGTLSTDSYFSTYGLFFKNVNNWKEEVANRNKEAGGTTQNNAKPAEGSKSSDGGSSRTPSVGQGLKPSTDGSAKPNEGTITAASYQVTVSSKGGWSTGFNGDIIVKNTSSSPISSWSVSLPVAAGAFAGTPSAWNGNFSYANGILTIKPADWAKKSLNAGESWSSGFNGGLAKDWLAVPTTISESIGFQADSSLIKLKDSQTSSGTTSPVTDPKPVDPIPPISSPTQPTVAGGVQNWEKDQGTTGSTETAQNPCNTVRWGDVSSVNPRCLSLMNTHQFGGPLHANATHALPLTNGKADMEAFGYLVEWGVYGRKFGVENVPAAQYSKLLFSFLRLNPDGSLQITDEWASLQKDDTGTLLGLPSDPFASTWENQDRGIMKRLTMLKARFPHLKTAFSVGGWTLSGQFASVTASDTKRKNFIDSAIRFANKFGFDGIDIDWEYPVVGGNTDSFLSGVSYVESNPGYPNDAANFTKLLKELNQAIVDKGADAARTRTKSGRIEISIAVGLGPKTIDAINYRDFIDYVDTINLMAYDFNGGWSKIVSHNAPLYDSSGLAGPKALGGFDQSEWNDHDAVLNILWNLKNQGGQALRAQGELGQGRIHKGDNGSTQQSTREALLSDPALAAYRKKLVLGVPFYGRLWSGSSANVPSGDITQPWFTGSAATIGSLENGVVDGKDVIYARDGQTARITANNRSSVWPKTAISANDFHWDPAACTSLVTTSGHIISFDDEDAIYHKAKYVKDKGLGGVMVWEVDGDTHDAKLAQSFVQGLKSGTSAPFGKTCLHK